LAATKPRTAAESDSVGKPCSGESQQKDVEEDRLICLSLSDKFLKLAKIFYEGVTSNFFLFLAYSSTRYCISNKWLCHFWCYYCWCNTNASPKQHPPVSL